MSDFNNHDVRSPKSTLRSRQTNKIIIMAKTTVKSGNPHPDRMPSTTGERSGKRRSNNPTKK